MKRKAATIAAALALSATMFTSIAVPATELSQAVETTQEIPCEEEKNVLLDIPETSAESETVTEPMVTEAEEVSSEAEASELFVESEEVTAETSATAESSVQEELPEKFEYDISSLSWDYMEGFAGGDTAAYSTATLYLANNALPLDTDNMEIVTAYDLTKQMLSRVGCGYSQSLRYDINYYDCSSLVARSMNDLGITSNVPITTADWNAKCQNMTVGDIITFVGSGKKLTYQLAAKNVTHLQNPEYFEIPGTIVVYIAPNTYSGHISVVVGSYDRQDNGHNPATEQSMILKDTTDYVAAQIEKTYSIPASQMTGVSSITGRTSIWLHSETMGTDMKKADGTPSGPYNPVWRVEAYSDAYGVCVTNAITGTEGNQVARYVLVPYDEKTTPAPSIKSVHVSDVTSDGYTVTVNFDAQAGVRSLQLPTWTEENGQDDLIWYNASASENTATFYVKTIDHNGETGNYITHVYLTDKEGRVAPIYGITATIPKKVPEPSTPVENSLPVITAAVASNITSSGYDVTATFDAPAGVVSVLMPTWTENGGQDDLVWHEASVSGNKATFHVNVSQHGGESGMYITHIYVEAKNGESKPVAVYATVPSDTSYIYNGVDYSAVFDPAYYLGYYPDLKSAFGSNYNLAFQHFIIYGMNEARIAKESFNVVNYCNRYVDLRNAFGSNWAAYYTHYIMYGINENRNAK